MNRLKAMQSFIQIADSGSLTKAALLSGGSLSAMVRSLAALEQHLGVRLLERTTRRMELTHEGRRYLSSARDVVAAADEADRRVVGLPAIHTGELVVFAPVVFGHMYIAPALTSFASHHPALRCTLDLLDREVSTDEVGADIGIHLGNSFNASVKVMELAQIRTVAVASPRYVQENGKPSHPKDLRLADCLRVSSLSARSTWHFHADGKSLTFSPQSQVQFNHSAPAVEFCASGTGIGVFASYLVMPLVRQGRLEVLLEAFEPPIQPVTLTHSRSANLPSRTRAFAQWLAMTAKAWDFGDSSKQPDRFTSGW